jgi:uncharacterized membrane protein YeiB
MAPPIKDGVSKRFFCHNLKIFQLFLVLFGVGFVLVVKEFEKNKQAEKIKKKSTY